MSGQGCALITGASSGIGAAFARALAARGTNLILIARSKEKLEALSCDLEGKHAISAVSLPADLSVPGAAAEVAESVQARNLEIDLLVNNAGFGGRGEFHKLPLDRQLEMIRLDVLAVMELTHLLLPGMVKKRAGGIINVSSVTGFQSIPYAAVYSATKAFVTSFSMGLAEELRPHGIPALMLSACVSASYNSATNQICFNVPIYGNYCVTSPVQLPVSAQLKACVQTCGSFIPTGLKVSIYANGTVIYSGVLWGSC